MPTQPIRGTIRASKGYASFRIFLGLIFFGVGLYQYSRLVSTGLPYFAMGIGLLFLVYGLIGVFSGKLIGTNIEIESAGSSATERLTELSRLKSSGLVSEAEYEAKRQEILKDL
jgi:hypothetical protein